MKILGSPPAASPRRILLIQLRRIGDTLLCTPAIRALRLAFPDARIDVAAEKPCHETLLGNPHIDKLWVSPRKGLVAQGKFMFSLQRENYDWVIDYLTNPRSAQLSFLSRAKVRLGLDRPGREWVYTHRGVQEDGDLDMYAVDMRLRMLEGLGVSPDGKRLEIFADQAEPREAARGRDIALSVPEPRVAIPVGKDDLAKRYPEDLTAALIGQLQTRGLHPVLTAGPGESAFAQNVLAAGARVPVIDQARVPTLAGAYRVCQLFVGPDSAPKHIAAAAGLPTVTLFALGRPTAWNDAQDPRQRVLVVPCELRPRCQRPLCEEERHFRRLDPAMIAEEALLHWREHGGNG